MWYKIDDYTFDLNRVQMIVEDTRNSEEVLRIFMESAGGPLANYIEIDRFDLDGRDRYDQIMALLNDGERTYIQK